ncbi:hypothetical protein BG004_008207 [Podila humilis]|nr:hypothetical protein BG004_008207 [Podila humilis]
MPTNALTLFCLVDGEIISFPVAIESDKTIGELKDLIKVKKPVDFEHVDANNLTLWKVSIPVAPKNERKEIWLADVPSKEELDETDDIADVFTEAPPKKRIHIIVQRPAPQGDLHVDIKSITDKFFASGSDIAIFLDAFVKGQGSLPTTVGPVGGLPRAWRRNMGEAPGGRPSLLFMDLPDPSTPEATTNNQAASSILELVTANNRPNLPVFGVSGCGKTRAVIELLSQYWGFYFNAADDDWGSSDMMTLYNTIRGYLKDVQNSSTPVDPETNNYHARKTTLLLFLSRLLIFNYCIGVQGIGKTFTSARWALLQVCPHVLFKDLFNELFVKLVQLRHHRVLDLVDYVRNVHEDVKSRLIKHGCLPKIKDGTRLLVINDEAQFLGDQFNGCFQSATSTDSPRPLLSPILHAFRDVGQHQLTLVTCGTGLSVSTLFWVQSSGSGLKDSSTTFEYVEFPGWTAKESIKTYIDRVRRCLPDYKAKQALDDHFPPEAIDILFKKFAGRFRPAITAIERIIESNRTGVWKETIDDVEDRLVSWSHRDIKGNLCYEIERLETKHNKYKHQFEGDSIDSMLGLLMYQRCMFGSHDLVLKEVDPLLVEHAFGRIKIISGKATTVIDEPFVSKAVENYFVANDPYFKKELRRRMKKSSPIEQGCVFERFMMKVFSETFNTLPLSEWKHKPKISDMCPALIGTVEIVGWREPGLEQGTTHAMMSMEEFMDAHVNHASIRKNTPVAPFFFPKSKPSGPDLVFFIRIDGTRLVPVFVQMKLHQGSSNFSETDWDDALSTVSAAKIEGHVKAFRDYCPDNVYISMIVAYPTKWTDKLPASSELPKDPSGVQQVVINISDDNFGNIFPKDHVEFIDRLKNARKRSADDSDSNDEDCSKKQKN